MYLNYLVKIPNIPTKITYRTVKETTYIYYEYERSYNPKTKKSNPKRATIGKRDTADTSMMRPNEIYLKYFSAEEHEEVPESVSRSGRSSCLRIGNWLVIRKIINECGFREILKKYVEDEDDVNLILDLASYSIISEDNANQYYPDYAYNHPLFTEDMHIYSDSKVSSFLRDLPDDLSVNFLNAWNENKKNTEKVYISYDSTNKNSQAGDLELVEFGHPKVDTGLPVFNYALAYDTQNRDPLFYEAYPGSINDVAQLEFMVNKAAGYGYKNLGFILDRGYFSKKNIQCMSEHGYSFIIMVKGQKELVNSLICEKKGSFEEKWANHIDDYDVYGTTIRRKLYETDEKERYFHLFYSPGKAYSERNQLVNKLRRMKKYMNSCKNEVVSFGPAYEKYYRLHYNEKNGHFLFPEDRTDVIENEMAMSGYFCIITSEKMTAKEALKLYKGRDASEKLFRGDKSYLGDKSLRVHSDSSAESKIFIEFIALIIRNRIYNHLMDEKLKLDKRPNYMTVPAAINELEKIEMIRLTDGEYRLDHAVTKTQKIILNAFDLDADKIKHYAKELGKFLKGCK